MTFLTWFSNRVRNVVVIAILMAVLAGHALTMLLDQMLAGFIVGGLAAVMMIMVAHPGIFKRYIDKRYGVVRPVYNPYNVGDVIGFYGTREAFLKEYSSTMGVQERIMGSTVVHPSGIVYMCLSPGRHHHVIVVMTVMERAGIANTREQGFMTNYGEHVTRYRALEIAKRANQLVMKNAPHDRLSSEDVW